MAFLSKYGVARHIYIAIPKAGSANHAVGADWTPAAGDVKISKDGGAAANVTNLPTAIAMGNSAIWDFSLTATEMQAAQIVVTVADSATKAVDDTGFEIETYGNASGQHAVDLADGVRAGLTALPNVASGSAGAIPTTGTGANQISVSSGQVILQAGTGAGQLDFTSGVVKANAVQLLGTAWLTPGTAGTPDVNVIASARPGIRKNTALAAFEFLMTDSTNHLPATGLTVSVTRSIDGGAFASGTLSAVTAISNGIYSVDFGAGDLNGNVITLRATATGADDLFVTIKTSP